MKKMSPIPPPPIILELDRLFGFKTLLTSPNNIIISINKKLQFIQFFLSGKFNDFMSIGNTIH